MRPKDDGRKWCELGEGRVGRGVSRFGKLRLRKWHGILSRRAQRQLTIG